MSVKERKSEKNGIWLCRNHAAMVDRDEKHFTVNMLLKWKTDAEKRAFEKIEGKMVNQGTEGFKYTLRCLYDDLVASKETIDMIVQSMERLGQSIVVPANRFHVMPDYESKIEKIAEYIGIDCASKMRMCFKEIKYYKEILSKEEPRFKNRSGWMMDGRAVGYSHELNYFLERMRLYNIFDVVETLGKLFDSETWS